MRLFELFTNTSATLLEYSRDVTAQKLGQPLLQKFRKEPPQWQARVTGAATDYDDHALQHLLELVERADPTKNKQYVPWIIRNYINNPSLRFEDAVTKVSEPLLKFFKLVNKKQIPAPNNDIGRIKNLAHLVQVVDQYPDVEDKKDENKGQSDQVHNDQDIRIIRPADQDAACYYGQGTKWCTAAQNNNMFNTYARKGELYIVIPKKPAHPGEKYQLHFETGQFMNELDRPVDPIDLCDRWPQLRTIFQQQAEANDSIGFILSKDELQSRLGRTLAVMKNITGYLQAERHTIEKECIKDLRTYGGAGEQIAELVNYGLEEEGSIITKEIINAIREDYSYAMDEDRLFDLLSDIVQNWYHDSEAGQTAQELFDDDGDAVMDIAFTVCGNIQDFIARYVLKTFKRAMLGIE